MTGLEPRTGWLLQIPARALQTLILARLTEKQVGGWLEAHGIRFRKTQTGLKRLPVEQLVRLINDFPENFPDKVVRAEFEEYRHGRSPTLHLFSVFAPALEDFDLDQANQRAQSSVTRANRRLEQVAEDAGVAPRLRELVLEPFHAVEDWPDGLHAGYHCETRLGYIAPDGQAVSTYQLFYGHVWIDLGRAFVALHLHPAALEPTLTQVLTQVLRVPPDLVRVDKQLKQELRFLQKASFRRVRLVDPRPERKRFRSVTLADDDNLARRSYLGWGYQQWEDDFPEMASARYFAEFIEERPITLSIGVRRGSLTLAGAVAASELRAWARDTGYQVVATWRARLQNHREAPPAALGHQRLWEHVLVEDFPDPLRRLVLDLVTALATIKERGDPQFRAWPLPVTAYELALAAAQPEAQELLGQATQAGGPAPWFRVMLRVDCPEEGCPSTTGLLVCPACRRNLFYLTLSDRDEPVLMCANDTCGRRWAGGFPLRTQCEEEHDIRLDWDEGMGAQMELFVGPELGFLIQQLLEGEDARYHYNADNESLWVRHTTLVYEPTRPAYLVREAGELYLNTGGGAVVQGSLTVKGDFIGRDKVETPTQEGGAR